MTYEDILLQKQKRLQPSGFKVNTLPDTLFPFQQFCVERALYAGRFGLFEEGGLGKTRQLLVWADEIVKHTNKKIIVLCPLAVALQSIKEGTKIGIEVCKFNAPNAGAVKIHIGNYEQAHLMDFSLYIGIVLDESSILKNHEGEYRNKLIAISKQYPYRLECSATPSPNDPMELGNHSEFLGAMGRNEMLAMYFVHDGGETSKWRIKGHAERDFWRFVSSWCIVVAKPSSIGFDDAGYNLPALHYNIHEVKTPVIKHSLFNDTAVSATEFNAELRRTQSQRLEVAASLANGTQHLFWCKQNAEAAALTKMIPGAINVQGSDNTEYKEEMLLAFATGELKNLVSKTSICGFGMNFQNCHNTTFVSPDFSFEKTWQAILRFLRFGQTHDVNANFILTDTMQNILTEFRRKKGQHEHMQRMMAEFVHEYQQPNMQNKNHIQQPIKLPNWLK